MAKKSKASASSANKSRRRKSQPSDPQSPRFYTLDVFLLTGPISQKFAKKNQVVSRTIQIRGDQTLEDLHDAIFKAYDRFDAHMYEFQFGKGQMQGPRYVLAGAFKSDMYDERPEGRVDKTTIDSLRLKKRQAFGYWFDFGDDWWHQINVEAIESTVPPGRYPKIIKREGNSPPQYLEEEE